MEEMDGTGDGEWGKGVYVIGMGTEGYGGGGGEVVAVMAGMAG